MYFIAGESGIARKLPTALPAGESGIPPALQQLSSDTGSFWSTSSRCARIDSRTVSPDTFFKDFVAAHKPVIIEHLVDHWGALSKWDDVGHLVEHCGDSYVTVNYSPDGYGDSVKQLQTGQRVFVKPLEKKMQFRAFVEDLYEGKKPSGVHPRAVPYLSRQNDSFSDEFKTLFKDVDTSLEFAERAFRNFPEAVNLWFGDERSVSSTHQDPFENFYSVVKGEKRFILYPPSDVPFLCEQVFQQANYVMRDGHFAVELEKDSFTPWITVDPLLTSDELGQKYPLYKFAHPVEVNLKKGETLYLPALWFHHVSQTGKTIAVNYWHDMAFDFRFTFYNFVRASSGLNSYGELPSELEIRKCLEKYGSCGEKQQCSVVFDFDWSLINENTDTWIIKQLTEGTGFYEEVMQKRVADKLGWTELMDFAVRTMTGPRFNVPRSAFDKCLISIPYFREMFEAAKLAHDKGCKLIILSDANQYYIDTILIHHDLHTVFSDVYTNHSSWDESSGEFRISPYHSVGRVPHGCPHCPTNLCKGGVLDDLIVGPSNERGKIIYIGDGGGDFCPYLRLTSSDCFYAREGYSCHKKINKYLNSLESIDGDAVKLRTWQCGADVLKYFEIDAVANELSSTTTSHSHEYYDAHAHFQLHDLASLRTALEHARKRGLVTSIINATSERDWDQVLQYRSEGSGIIAGLGVHPWYIDETLGEENENWAVRLKCRLKADSSILVGEIGLDKLKGNLEKQKEICKEQLKIAKHLHRTIAGIHCVRCHGTMLDLLRSVFPDGELAPKMLMHGWSGAAEITKIYCKHFPNMYFSFSAPLRGKQLKGGVKCVPIDRILVETDDKSPRHIFQSYSAVISHMMETMDSTKNMTDYDIVAKIGKNFKSLYS
eukprot:g4269.t1